MLEAGFTQGQGGALPLECKMKHPEENSWPSTAQNSTGSAPRSRVDVWQPREAVWQCESCCCVGQSGWAAIGVLAVTHACYKMSP